MDQYLYAIKNGVVKLNDLYNYKHHLVDKLFNPATEIAYWRKNFALQHYFNAPNSTFTHLTRKTIEQLIIDVTLGRDEFSYIDYVEDRKEYDLEIFNIALGYIDDNFSIYYEANW